MSIHTNRTKDILLKTSIVGLAFMTLVASSGISILTGGGDTGGGGTGGGDTGGGGTGDGTPDPVGVSLSLINPGSTSGVYTETVDKTFVSANLTFRANSAFLANGAYTKVQGHQVKAAYGKNEEAVGSATTSYIKSAGEFSGILTSTTKHTTLSQAQVVFGGAQLTSLNDLRTDINVLQNNISTKPGSAEILTWKASLKSKLTELASLISYEGLQVSLRPLASGNGFYGLFVNNESGGYKQISGVYSLASGKSIANYGALQGAGGTTTYNSKFSGAGAVGGVQLIDLKGTGSVSANFDSQSLTGSFAVSNETNTETGTIAFSGAMGADAGGVSGLVFNSSGATYTKIKGELSSMSGGSAEAALIEGGNSIMGSVNITSGSNAVVGAFGGDK